MTQCLNCPHQDFEHYNATLDDTSYAVCQIPGCKCRGLRTQEWKPQMPLHNPCTCEPGQTGVVPASVCLIHSERPEFMQKDQRVKPDMDKVMGLILKAAANSRDNAAHGGYTDDGGARHMEAQVRFYRAGMNGEIPSEWNEYVKQATRESDAEYQIYLRLKKKFEEE